MMEVGVQLQRKSSEIAIGISINHLSTSLIAKETQIGGGG